MKPIKILILLSIFFCACSDNDSCNSCPDIDTTNTAKWTEIKISSTNDFGDVDFYNDTIGVICGSSGTLLKTIDGGQNWQALNAGVYYSFMKVFMLNENEFYTSRRGLYKTSNGGDSFKEIGGLSNSPGTIFEIHFFDSKNGLIYKEGEILKTSDGGLNWEVVYSEAGFAGEMQFVSDSIGFIAGGISYDGFSEGEMHKTIDGGKSWSKVDLPMEIQKSEIISIYFTSENVGFLSNFNRKLYVTHDGGKTWNLKQANMPVEIYDMVFLTQNEGYGIGFRYIYKFTDEAATWSKEYEDSTRLLASITKTPTGKIFVVGNDGIILKKE